VEYLLPYVSVLSIAYVVRMLLCYKLETAAGINVMPLLC